MAGKVGERNGKTVYGKAGRQILQNRHQRTW
jgi:hypothetical protein